MIRLGARAVRKMSAPAVRRLGAPAVKRLGPPAVRKIDASAVRRLGARAVRKLSAPLAVRWLIRNCRIQRLFLLLIQESTVHRTQITDQEPSLNT